MTGGQVVINAWQAAGEYPGAIAGAALGVGVTVYAVRKGWRFLRSMI